MRKFILCALSLGLTLGWTSCQSDSPSIDGVVEPVAKTGVVKFAVSTEFNEEVSGLRQSYLPADSYIEALDYFIYNKADGILVKKKRIEKADIKLNVDPKSIIITDTLIYGTYNICIMASAGANLPYNWIGDDELHDFNKLKFEVTEIPNDMFCDLFELTVNANSTSLKAKLPRITSKIEIKSSDFMNSIPDDVKTVQFAVGSDFPLTYYPKEKSVALSNRDDWEIAWELSNYYFATFPYNKYQFGLVVENDIFSFYLLPTTGYLPYEKPSPQIDLYARIVRDSGVEVKLIKKDLKTYRNKITRLTGNLFTNNGVGIDPSIDTEWDETIEESFD